MGNINYELYVAMKEHFNSSELRKICFFLNIDIEDLPGDTFGERIIELISLSQRNSRIGELIETVQKERDHINWYELAGIQPEPSTLNLQLPPDIDEILDFAKKIAKEGGRSARQYFEDKENIPFEPEIVKNFTTEADNEANKVIVEGIRKRFSTNTRKLTAKKFKNLIQFSYKNLFMRKNRQGHSPIPLFNAVFVEFVKKLNSFIIREICCIETLNTSLPKGLFEIFLGE